MTGNDRRENAPIVKSEYDDGPLVPPVPASKKSDREDSGPLFEPNRWYLRCVLQPRMKVGNHTWERWVLAGLTTSRPGTKSELIYTDEKFERILRMATDDLPKTYTSPHAERNKARKKRDA